MKRMINIQRMFKSINNIKKISKLIEKKANPNYKQYGKAILHKISMDKEPNIQVIEILVNSKADINLFDSFDSRKAVIFSRKKTTIKDKRIGFETTPLIFLCGNENIKKEILKVYRIKSKCKSI
eukprot:TRINITY_DN9798_c0_g1_i1.p2 TRINITY_DN9798_c0_g1~~TRINITY_DN9798_c0_g1_i1.p2  ORF type:complete len:124 (+),score=19.95 TRINITY_DN9798_c0_g1_i1:26-397(+)